MLGYFASGDITSCKRGAVFLATKAFKPLVHYLATNFWNREKMDWPKKLVPHSLKSYTFVQF